MDIPPSHNNDYDDNIQYSQEFVYPNDEVKDNEKHFDVSANEVLIRLSTLLFCADKPKQTLAALLFAAGIDVGVYLGCKNQINDIAKLLGISKQNFNKHIKKYQMEFGLISYNGRVNTLRETSRKTNYRPTKYL